MPELWTVLLVRVNPCAGQLPYVLDAASYGRETAVNIAARCNVNWCARPGLRDVYWFALPYSDAWDLVASGVCERRVQS